MKVIVHCGLPKTGTSALQAALAEQRDELIRFGVAYPAIAFPPDVNHKLITPLFLDRARWPAQLTQDGSLTLSDARIRRRAAVAWKAIHAAAERRPSHLVISGESFARASAGADATRMHYLFAGLGGDVTYVVYVRDPADWYHSAVRQALKTRGEFISPGPTAVRSFVEALEAAGGTVAVRGYQRGSLVGGDIVQDFRAAFLAGALPAGSLRSRASNDSLSAEATAVLVEYRAAEVPEPPGAPSPRLYRLHRILHELDPLVPHATSPRLVDGLREAITAASTDLDWLRDRYGIAFEGVDYPVSTGGETPDLSGYVCLEDVCVIDSDRLDRLRALSLAELAEVSRLRRSVEYVLHGEVGPASLRRATRWMRSAARRVAPR